MKKRIMSIAMALILSMSFGIAAMAAPGDALEQEISGQGYISNDETDTQVMVDITVPASFLWYADNSTFNAVDDVYDIVSGTYQIINHSETVNLLVELMGYSAVGTGTVEESDITLNLTGDLAANGYGQDLFVNPSIGVYPTLLASANGVTDGVGVSTWTFGFSGSYNQNTLPTDQQLTNYVIELEFTASSIS